MKNISLKSFLPTASFVMSFLLAAVTAYLLVSHFQHTVLQAWFNSSLTSQADTENYSSNDIAGTPTYVYYDEQSADEGCGCPSCCVVSYVR
jgi:hypothetical protein